MNYPKRAVLFLEETQSLPENMKPLMLESFLGVPIMKWMSAHLAAEGVQRFLVVSEPGYAAEIRSCFAADADVTVTDLGAELTAFLDTDEQVLVLVRAALPLKEAGAGFVYQASGADLQASWKVKMTNAVQGAELVPGWLPVFGPETLAELEPLYRERGIQPPCEG